MTVTLPAPSGRAIALLALSGLNAVALLGVSLWLITRAAEQPPILYLQLAIVGVRAFALGRAFFRYVGRLVSHDSAFRQLAHIRSHVFDRLSVARPLRLSARQSGTLVSTFVRDVDSLQDHALRFVEPLWVNAIVIATTVAATTSISPPSGLIVALGCALAIGAMIAIDGFVARHSARQAAPIRGELFSEITERIRHDALLRAFGAAGQAEESIARLDARLHRVLVGPGMVAALSAAISTVTVGLVAILVIGNYMTINVVSTSGTPPLFTVVALSSLALGEFIMATPSILEARRVVRAASARIDETVGAAERIWEMPLERSNTIDEIDNLSLSSVTVTYSNRSDIAAGPISFVAQRGDVVVVTGASGSGKSTLAHALVGFLPVDSGVFQINGHDANAIPPTELRQLIGLCEQQPHIFAESLRHNLDFANDTATDEQLWSILERVGLDVWARERDGLETQLGENGTLVSGGQAQRVALARVLLADRSVVVLDEPTAHVQPDLAERLLHDILAATKDSILIVLSHTPVPPARHTINVSLD